MALDWLLRSILLMIIIQSMSVSSKSDSKALIKLKNYFVNASALSSWVNGSAPCKGNATWNGVLCHKGAVTGIRLEKMGLSGKIDVDALLDISGLRSVSFANNSFSGSIPELSRLGYLKSIYLTGNQFSGDIPSDFFLKMTSLKKLWLSDNKFSGNIPSSLVHLPNLIELHLENNRFNGTIPSLHQSKLTIFNVSNNKLRGQIPAGLEKFNLTSFEGNSDLCGETIGKECGKIALSSSAVSTEPANTPASQNATNNEGEATIYRSTTSAGIITLSAMLFTVAAVIIYSVKDRIRNFQFGQHDSIRNNYDEAVQVQVTMPVKSMEMEETKKIGKGNNQNKGRASDLVMLNDEKGVFGLQDLMRAAAEALGNGGLGSSYKALMTNGTDVVVKRLREMNALGKDSFDAELRNLGRLRHPNILAPLAYHYRKDEQLLIYEYMPKGSLLYALHGDKAPSHAELSWPTRLNIVVGIARGLGYLHTELASFDLPHGNLKSSNIFLNPDNEPEISEFGFNELTCPSVGRETLLAYKAPGAAEFGVSPKCDVYCLGLIILEILTGKFPSQYINNGPGGIDLIEMVESSIAQRSVSELLDPDIANSTNSLAEMIELLHIGACCVERNPAKRLELNEAIKRVEEVKLASGDSDSRAIHLVPSLTEGYADASPRNHQSTNAKEGYGYGEISKKKGFGSRSFTNSSQYSFASPESTFLNNDN